MCQFTATILCFHPMFNKSSPSSSFSSFCVRQAHLHFCTVCLVSTKKCGIQTATTKLGAPNHTETIIEPQFPHSGAIHSGRLSMATTKVSRTDESTTITPTMFRPFSPVCDTSHKTTRRKKRRKDTHSGNSVQTSSTVTVSSRQCCSKHLQMTQSRSNWRFMRNESHLSSNHHHQVSSPPLFQAVRCWSRTPTLKTLLLFVWLLLHVWHCLLTTVSAQSYDPMDSVQSSSASDSTSNGFYYTEYNLADYCSEENWSDYPGRHRIRLEKSVKIRRPSIVDFQYNDTHRQRLGGGRGFGPRYSLIDPPPNNDNDNANANQGRRSSGPNFVPYCLLSFYADFGYRIYAEGFATGLQKGGKDWFTETLHFRTHSGEAGGAGAFVITTHKDTLSLVFEQLHQREFSFHLVMTPFREAVQTPDYDQFDGGGGGGGGGRCDSGREYRCRNGRCIANYLTCDHHNNCADHSDEDSHCLSKVPTTTPTTTTTTTKTTTTTTRWSVWDRPDDPSLPPDDRDELPTYDIDGNRIEPQPPSKSDPSIPDYIDVPRPSDPPDFRVPTTRRPFYYDTMNGVGGSAISRGGFLEDLFSFSAEGKVSNVVYVVRYLLAVLVIIILVTLVNFLIWCLITKRDQSFMAPAASPTPTQRPMPGGPAPATSTLSVISDV